MTFREIKPGGIVFFILSIETIEEIRETGRQGLSRFPSCAGRTLIPGAGPSRTDLFALSRTF